LCPFKVTKDAGWPYPCHFINTPVPPVSIVKVVITASAQVWSVPDEVTLGVHSESAGLLARASGPVSLLGYFNFHVWHL
jgi:hypothetical protein